MSGDSESGNEDISDEDLTGARHEKAGEGPFQPIDPTVPNAPVPPGEGPGPGGPAPPADGTAPPWIVDPTPTPAPVRATPWPPAGIGHDPALGNPWFPPNAPPPAWGTAAPPGWSPEPRRAPREPLRGRGWLVVALVAALIGAGAGAAVGATVATRSQQTVVREFFPNASVLAKPKDVQEVLAKVMPAVVSIQTTSFQSGSNILGGGSEVQGAGSGMLVTPDGEVLTNNHVVAGASALKVSLLGQTTQDNAHVLGTDPGNDVALVKIDGVTSLPVVSLGDSDAAQIGDSVLAIGNALALAGGPTVTQGIVSAKNRTLSAQDPGTNASESLTRLIQTDAAINPGNSGGPLVNAQGQVIGMNTAVADGTGGGSGGIGGSSQNAQVQSIGFALSINQVRPLVGQLAKGGTVQQSLAFLGVEAVTVTPSLRQTYHLTPTQGAVVGSVTGNPAKQAGLQVGDVITAVDGTQVNSADDLVNAVGAHKPGDKVTLTVVRGSRQLSVPVTLGTKPTQS